MKAYSAYEAYNMNTQTAANACQCNSTGFFAMPECATASKQAMGDMRAMNSMNSANGYIYGVDLLGALLFCLFALLLSSVLVASLVLVHIYAFVIIISIIIRITEPQFNKRRVVSLKSEDIG